jgi:Tfp pilus tip-associated adhesin PilY1
LKLCRAEDGTSCNTSSWTGGRLFAATSSGGIRPIYTLAAVTKDSEGNFWVYWGTGDKTDPTAANAQEKIMAIKDTDRSSTRGYSDLENLTTEGGTIAGDKFGYYINLTGQGEKVLADPTVFGGVLYVTTFTPSNSNNPCELGGAATLYGIDAKTGAGALPLTDTPRSMSVGTGIASAPVVSLKPGGGLVPDLYVTTSGGGLIGAQTQRVNIDPPGLANRNNLLFWKDRRIEP